MSGGQYIWGVVFCLACWTSGAAAVGTTAQEQANAVLILNFLGDVTVGNVNPAVDRDVAAASTLTIDGTADTLGFVGDHVGLAGWKSGLAAFAQAGLPSTSNIQIQGSTGDRVVATFSQAFSPTNRPNCGAQPAAFLFIVIASKIERGILAWDSSCLSNALGNPATLAAPFHTETIPPQLTGGVPSGLIAPASTRFTRMQDFWTEVAGGRASRAVTNFMTPSPDPSTLLLGSPAVPIAGTYTGTVNTTLFFQLLEGHLGPVISNVRSWTVHNNVGFLTFVADWTSKIDNSVGCKSDTVLVFHEFSADSRIQEMTIYPNTACLARVLASLRSSSLGRTASEVALAVAATSIGSALTQNSAPAFRSIEGLLTPNDFRLHYPGPRDRIPFAGTFTAGEYTNIFLPSHSSNSRITGPTVVKAVRGNTAIIEVPITYPATDPTRVACNKPLTYQLVADAAGLVRDILAIIDTDCVAEAFSPDLPYDATSQRNAPNPLGAAPTPLTSTLLEFDELVLFNNIQNWRPVLGSDVGRVFAATAAPNYALVFNGPTGQVVPHYGTFNGAAGRTEFENQITSLHSTGGESSYTLHTVEGNCVYASYRTNYVLSRTGSVPCPDQLVQVKYTFNNAGQVEREERTTDTACRIAALQTLGVATVASGPTPSAPATTAFAFTPTTPVGPSPPPVQTFQSDDDDSNTTWILVGILVPTGCCLLLSSLLAACSYGSSHRHRDYDTSVPYYAPGVPDPVPAPALASPGFTPIQADFAPYSPRGSPALDAGFPVPPLSPGPISPRAFSPTAFSPAVSPTAFGTRPPYPPHSPF